MTGGLAIGGNNIFYLEDGCLNCSHVLVVLEEVVERLGRTFADVRTRRIAFGWHDPSTRKGWTQEEIRLLGTASDLEIAR